MPSIPTHSYSPNLPSPRWIARYLSLLSVHLLVSLPSYIQAVEVIDSAVNPANGHTYYLLSLATWTDAEAFAQTHLSSHLVTVDDEAENNWIYSQWSAKQHLWIGLNDVLNEDTFVWADGSTSAYNNWKENEPNDEHGGEDYVICFGEWNDVRNVGDGLGGAYGVVEVATAQPSLVSISISGPATVPENTSTDYTCTAHYDDGSTEDVTSATGFELLSRPLPTLLDMSGNVLTVFELSYDLPRTIQATYDGFTATTNVTAIDVPKRIDIVGPTEVPEASTNHYQCYAVFSTSKSNDVTQAASWSGPGGRVPVAWFESPGELGTRNVTVDSTVALNASYVHPESGTSLDADPYEVTVLNLSFEIIPYLVEWHNDGRPELAGQYDSGRYRHQYFEGQTVFLPFTVTSTVDTNVSLYVEAAHEDTHGAPISVLPGGLPVHLTPGDNTLDVPQIGWEIEDPTPCGHYHFRAWIEGDEGVLDTTEAGPDTTDIDATGVWCESDLERVQVCRGNPVILIHGITGSAGTFGDMEAILTENESLATVSFDYHGLTDTIDEKATIENIAAAFMGAERLYDTEDTPIAGSENLAHSIVWTTNYYDRETVDVVAHSMGGLVARAYMANMADDGRVSYLYRGEIDKLVTVASPLCGRHKVTGLAAVMEILDDALRTLTMEGWTLSVGWPAKQMQQMELGSEFMWTLHSRSSVYEKHFAIGGSIRPLDELAYPDNALDPVVPISSALAYTMASHWRYVEGAEYNHLGIANVKSGSENLHQPYYLIREYLVDGTTAGVGGDPSSLAFSFAPVMIRTVANGGADAVRTSVRVPGVGIYNKWIPEVDHQHGTHGTLSANGCYSGRITFKITPLFFDAFTYSRTEFEANVTGGRLFQREVDMPLDSDQNGNGLPDGYEGVCGLGVESGLYDDTDADGMENGDELRMGYNAGDSNDCFSVNRLWVGNSNSLVLSCDGLPGYSYHLQASAGLTGDWSNVDASVTGDGSPIYFSRPLLATNCFYRVNATPLDVP